MRRKDKWGLGIISFIIIISLIIPMVKKENIKEANLAGTWYSEDENVLSKAIDGYLKKAEKKTDKKIKGLIVPHAGYEYSGLVAAYGYKQLKNDYKTVVVIAPSHSVIVEGAAVLNASYYNTPLGKIKISNKTTKHLMNN